MLQFLRNVAVPAIYPVPTADESGLCVARKMSELGQKRTLRQLTIEVCFTANVMSALMVNCSGYASSPSRYIRNSESTHSEEAQPQRSSFLALAPDPGANFVNEEIRCQRGPYATTACEARLGGDGLT
jgi:hypothetical protein